MTSNHLNTAEYHQYYKSYIDKATNIDIVEGLAINLKKGMTFLSEIPEEKHNYAYADGKWAIKDLLLHIIDAERVFAYRALRIARGDKTPLAGFDQDIYVANAHAVNRSFKSLIEEYEAVRSSTITLFSSFEEDALLRIGEASGSAISVRALGYIISGHENHHMAVIKERYL
ncbi:MAG: DinB family protein [Bacteroidota bacterium]